MDFKELLIIIYVGFFVLLCEGRNPYDGESLSSMYDVGDLKVHQNSPRKWEITWKFEDFFSLPQYRQLTRFHKSERVHFHIYLSPKGIYEKEGFSPFWLAYGFERSISTEEELFQNVTCEFYVKTSEDRLYRVLEDRGNIQKYGGHCNSLIPRSEIVGRNDSLVPGGVLTLVAKLQWRTKNDEPIQTADNVESKSSESDRLETQSVDIEDYQPCLDHKGKEVWHGDPFTPLASDLCTQCTCLHGKPQKCGSVSCLLPENCREYHAVSDKCCEFVCLDTDFPNKTSRNGTFAVKDETINQEIPERFGILKIDEDSGASVDVTWRIHDFFSLPYRKDVGILSPNFRSDDFHGYFAMDPKGSTNIPGFISFRSIVFRGNNRREKIYPQLYLKERDGTLHKFPAREESQNFFAGYVPESEINDRKEEMVPGGALTLLFKFSSTEDNDDSSGLAKGTISTDLRSSANYPSLASLNDVGVLETKQNTDSIWEVKWKIQDFFILPQYRQFTQSFGSEKFWFFIYMTPKGIYNTADISTLFFNWRFKSNSPDTSFPQFSVQFYATTKEGMLYSFAESNCSVAKYGGWCKSLIPRREIIDRRDSLVPEGELTIVAKIRQLTAASTTEGNSIESEALEKTREITSNDVITIGRVGKVEISRDSPTRVDIKWEIENLFTLSFRQDIGILSPNFQSRGFKGYLEMNPKGSVRGSGYMKFKGVIFRQGSSSGGIFYKLFLKDKDATLHEFPVKEEFQNYFSCELPKSAINVRKETMVPGDVLTVVLKLSTTKDFGDDREPAQWPSTTDLPYPTDDPSLASKKSTSKIEEIRKNGDCDCESMESSMQKFSSDVLSLYKTCEYSDISLECDDNKVLAHKSILSARSQVFADMFRSEVGKAAATVDVSDVPFPTLDLMLQYIYSGVLEIPSDLLELTALCKAADEYEIASLKSTCLSQIFTRID